MDKSEKVDNGLLNFESDIDKLWESEFHGVKYCINVIANTSVLRIEVESPETNEHWSAEFQSSYIEDITQKAGNYKKFDVFIKMLMSALSKESESVFVDLLTYADLELLKARKSSSNTSINTQPISSGATTASTSATNKHHTKRYMILTYSSEFDRVHYPLPLHYEEIPNSRTLIKIITRLRHQLKQHQQGGVHNKIVGNKNDEDVMKLVNQLRQENIDLRKRLNIALSSNTYMKSGASTYGNTANSPSGTNGSNSVFSSTSDLITVNGKLRRQLDQVKHELHDLSIAYEKLRTDSAKEIMKWQTIASGGPPSTSHSTRSISSRGSTAVDSHILYPGGVPSSRSKSSSSRSASRNGQGTGEYRGTRGNSDIDMLRRKIIQLEKDLSIERRANQNLSRLAPSGGSTGSNSRRVRSSGYNSAPSSRQGTPTGNSGSGNGGSSFHRRPSPQPSSSRQTSRSSSVASDRSRGRTPQSSVPSPRTTKPAQHVRNMSQGSSTRSRSASPQVRGDSAGYNDKRAWGSGNGSRPRGGRDPGLNSTNSSLMSDRSTTSSRRSQQSTSSQKPSSSSSAAGPGYDNSCNRMTGSSPARQRNPSPYTSTNERAISNSTRTKPKQSTSSAAAIKPDRVSLLHIIEHQKQRSNSDNNRRMDRMDRGGGYREDKGDINRPSSVYENYAEVLAMSEELPSHPSTHTQDYDVIPINPIIHPSTMRQSMAVQSVASSMTSLPDNANIHIRPSTSSMAAIRKMNTNGNDRYNNNNNNNNNSNNSNIDGQGRDHISSNEESKATSNTYVYNRDISRDDDDDGVVISNRNIINKNQGLRGSYDSTNRDRDTNLAPPSPAMALQDNYINENNTKSIRDSIQYESRLKSGSTAPNNSNSAPNLRQSMIYETEEYSKKNAIDTNRTSVDSSIRRSMTYSSSTPSTTTTTTTINNPNKGNNSARSTDKDDELSLIDKRILALQSYLDQARSGLNKDLSATTS